MDIRQLSLYLVQLITFSCNECKPPKMNQSGEEDRNFRLTCLIMLCAFTVHSMLLVAVPIYSEKLGLSSLQIGLVIGIPYALPLLIAIPASSLISKFGGRASLCFGGTCFLFAVVLMAKFFSLWGLVAAQVIVGLAHMCMILAAQTIISGLGEGRS